MTFSLLAKIHLKSDIQEMISFFYGHKELRRLCPFQSKGEGRVGSPGRKEVWEGRESPGQSVNSPGQQPPIRPTGHGSPASNTLAATDGLCPTCRAQGLICRDMRLASHWEPVLLFHSRKSLDLINDSSSSPSDLSLVRLLCMSCTKSSNVESHTAKRAAHMCSWQLWRSRHSRRLSSSMPFTLDHTRGPFLLLLITRFLSFATGSWKQLLSTSKTHHCIKFLPALSLNSAIILKTILGWVGNAMVLNGLPWKRTEIILSFLRLHPSTAFQTLLLTMMATPFLLRDSCPQ